jgi:RNA polymerase sigma factor (sigma-70 family)
METGNRSLIWEFHASAMVQNLRPGGQFASNSFLPGSFLIKHSERMPPAQSQPEEATLLVRRALDQHESNLIAYTAGILNGDVERAREVVQDALLKLYLTDPQKVRDSLKAWLFTVCRNRALDVLRKEQRLDVGNEDALGNAVSFDPDPSENAVSHELYERIWDLVEKLRPNQKEVIRLKFMHDCSYQQIADITGLSVGNVGFIMHMAIKKLREHLNRELTSRPH